ncbi:MAG TPA: hypothetical protein VKY53_04125 [Marinobacter sp.]|nr:hypothetical protein [Marinobacter sp.]
MMSWARVFVWIVLLPVAGVALADSRGGEPTAPGFEIAGVSASGGDDDPRVLYILPWQAPTLPRRPRTELDQEAPELTRPRAAPELDGHRQFRDSLNPLVLSSQPATGNPNQP